MTRIGSFPPVPLPACLHRRSLLRVALGGAAFSASAALLAACGEEIAPTSPPTIRPTTVPTVAAPTTAPTAVAPMTTATAPAATVAAPPAATMPAATAASTTAPTMPTAAPAAATAPVDGRIPSPAPGVPDAYTKLPPAAKTVNTVPGRGGKMTVFNIAYFPPVPGRNDNAYWRELEKRLGVQIEPTFAPSGMAYTEKFAAIAASGDLADITNLVGPTPEQLRLIQQGAFTDLTSELTGDALKQYPNLALYPPQLWKNAAIRGKLYGVPRPLPLIGDVLAYRKDWAEKVGPARPKNAEEFFTLMTRMTKDDPDGNGKADSWGLGSQSTQTYALPYLAQMFHVPNNWRKNPDGTLTKGLETEEFKQAVAYARRLFEAGVYHPDTATTTTAQLDGFILAGRVGSRITGAFGLPGPGKLWEKFASTNPMSGNPLDRLAHLVPPAHDGGAGITHNASGIFGLAAIPAKVGRDRERVKELLRVLNYYAAPFGSEEWLFLNYGVAGTHHTVGADGSPVQTDLGKKEIGDLWTLATGERVYFYPTPPGGAKYMQDVTRDMLAVGINDPTVGLYSPTEAMKGAELTQLATDRLNAIISGREPLAALDTYVKDWRSRGGDAIRKEYEAELKG